MQTGMLKWKLRVTGLLLHLLQMFKIIKVFKASGGKFVLTKILDINQENRSTINIYESAAGVTIFEGHA